MVFMKEPETTAGILEVMAKKGGADAKRAAALSERLRLASFRSHTRQMKTSFTPAFVEPAAPERDPSRRLTNQPGWKLKAREIFRVSFHRP